MKSKKLVMALGLVALLLMVVGVAGCSSAESEQPANGQSANPLEDITNPDDYQGQVWEGKLSDIPGYPEGRPVADGIVCKVTSNTLDLEVATTGVAKMEGDASGWRYEPGTETKMVQVVFNPDTKVYRWLHRVAKPELEEVTLDDLSTGQMIMVWGEEAGDRIFADTIIIRH